MTPKNIEIRDQLKNRLKPSRYEHTLGVAYTADCLAMRYGSDIAQAETAGLLHDCARQYSNRKILEKCQELGMEISEAEQSSPILLHARLGAWMASHKYGINDPEIADAIRYHTTGRPDMTLTEKIIYIADYIEPQRDKAPNLEKIRLLAFQDLDACLYEIMSDTLKYLNQSGNTVDTATCEAYLYYKKRTCL